MHEALADHIATPTDPRQRVFHAPAHRPDGGHKPGEEQRGAHELQLGAHARKLSVEVAGGQHRQRLEQRREVGDQAVRRGEGEKAAVRGAKGPDAVAVHDRRKDERRQIGARERAKAEGDHPPRAVLRAAPGRKHGHSHERRHPPGQVEAVTGQRQASQEAQADRRRHQTVVRQDRDPRHDPDERRPHARGGDQRVRVRVGREDRRQAAVPGARDTTATEADQRRTHHRRGPAAKRARR